MTKQEKIKEAWIESGFIWDQIKGLINENGWMSLDSPELKKTLTGYSNAVSECLIKGVGFSGKNFMVVLESLKGIDDNNGWQKIESEDDLPKKEGVYLFQHKDGATYHLTYSPGFSSIISCTHWKPIVKDLPPIY